MPLNANGSDSRADPQGAATEAEPLNGTRPTLQGRIEKLSATEIQGWAWDPQTPDRRIRLELVEGESQLLVVVADDNRPDLIRLGCGDGRYGFTIPLDDELLTEGRSILTLRCADTGAPLPGSPIVYERQRPIAAATQSVAEPHSIFRSYIDKIIDREILGWIMIPDQPSHRCSVLLKEGDGILARTMASRFRHDLLSAGVGDGCYAFVLEPPRSLSDGHEHLLEVVEEETGTPVTTAPIRWRRDAVMPSGVDRSVYLAPVESQKVPDIPRPQQTSGIVGIIHSVISHIRSRGHLALAPETPREVTISLAKIYSLADADAVFYSYKTILGRAPNADGFRKLFDALRRGAMDRRQLIDVLQREPKAMRVRLIEDALEPGTEAARTDEYPFSGVNEFPLENADAFLTYTSRAFGGSDPDARGYVGDCNAMVGGLSQTQAPLTKLGSEDFKTRHEPAALLGVTREAELFQMLFSVIEGMSRAVVMHEYELCLLRNRLEEIA